MAIRFGTTGMDNLVGTTDSDIFSMTADNFITDNVNGGSGNDTINYGASHVGVTVTLTDPTTAGGASGGTVEADFAMSFINPSTGAYIQFNHHQVVANLTSIENATGSKYDDVLTGNSGNNVLTGGGGHDILTGGAGNDAFVFNNLSDSPAVPIGAGFYKSLDYITDFTPGQDHIDLHGLANETTGHVPLNFTDHFTGVAGQVVTAFMSDSTNQGTGFLAAVDLNGDHAADFEIFVHTSQPHVLLHASDFLL
jgi:Ca2+-binding RTX toxin-like protein